MKNLMRFRLSIALLCAVVFGFGAISATAVEAASPKAIVVTSFGTTFDDQRRDSIESVENKIKAGFPDYEVRRAFTSKIVMKRLAERGIYVDSLEQALEKLRQEGYQEVVVQPTLFTPGEEYDNKIVAVVHQYAHAFDKLVVGRPAVTFTGAHGTPNDYAIAAKALKTQLPVLQLADRAVVFMGHGSPNHVNPVYSRLQEQLDAAGANAVIGVVEPTGPTIEDVQAILKERGVKRVILMPLMVVAGDHANNDMAGDEEDSWENILLADGYQVSVYVHGLGENAAFQDIYVQHVRDAVYGNYQKAHHGSKK